MTANSKTAVGKSGQKVEMLMKQARRFAPTIFLGIFWITAQVAKNFGISASAANWIVVVCATISTLLIVAQRLPLQNIFGSIATMSAGGAVLLFTNRVLQVSPLRFFGIENSSPIFLLLIWTTTLMNVRGAMKVFLRSWKKSENYGLWLIAFSGLAIAVFDQNSQRSVGSFFTTAVFAWMTLIASVPWFIDKKRLHVEPDFQPVLLLGILFFQGLCGVN